MEMLGSLHGCNAPCQEPQLHVLAVCKAASVLTGSREVCGDSYVGIFQRYSSRGVLGIIFT